MVALLMEHMVIFFLLLVLWVALRVVGDRWNGKKFSVFVWFLGIEKRGELFPVVFAKEQVIPRKQIFSWSEKLFLNSTNKSTALAF